MSGNLQHGRQRWALSKDPDP